MLALPVAVAEGWTPPAETPPVPWLLALLAVSTGLPFFALAATAPLLQAWLWASGQAAGGDPYRLYAASNLGSLLALVGYPLLLEPLFGLRGQSWLWSAGYLVFLALMVAVAVLLWRGTGRAPPRPAEAPPPGLRRRLHWLVLAFVPVGLLMGVTLHVTTNLVAIPLFWVAPLALYLLSFVLVFARKALLPHAWMVRLQPYLLIILALELPFPVQETMPVVGLHLLVFFVTAMVCHGELARRRPAPEQLTDFYLWLALGGVLGGLAVAILAPLVFDAVVEYPLLLVLACLLRPGTWTSGGRRLVLDLVLSALILLPVVAIALSPVGSLFALGGVAVYFYAVFAGVLVFSSNARSPGFALGLGALLLAGGLAPGLGDDVLVRKRSFFGVSRVQTTTAGFHLLWHGATIHGAQKFEPGRPRPITYYVRTGPVGQVFDSLRVEGRPLSVAVVGLGPGAAACYREEGDSWRFHEIDPAVVAIAREPRYFSYLSACAPEAPVLLGDARRTLASVPDGGLDLLVLDAFTSDVVPLHLLTLEAFRLYRSKLAAGGLVLVNISNGHFRLQPVLAALARESGLSALGQRWRPGKAAARRYEFGSDWVLLAAEEARLVGFASSGHWRPLAVAPGTRAWSDDSADIMGVIRW